MSCAACGHDNPRGNRFCGGCGTALERTCPSCAAANPPDHRFCGSCGTALDAALQRGRDLRTYTPKHLAERILQSKAAMEGERKQVSVLFADLKGSMALAELGRASEQVGALGGRCAKRRAYTRRTASRGWPPGPRRGSTRELHPLRSRTPTRVRRVEALLEG